jgi:GTP 3',8-cyclase
VVPLVFKTRERRAASLAGSIPVRLRHQRGLGEPRHLTVLDRHDAVALRLRRREDVRFVTFVTDAYAGGMLTDSYGRVAADLRVSLTDRCNLRCAYCMPPEGLDWLPAPEVLTGDEVVRLIRIGVETLGIREVRFTGGEPLLRRDLVSIVAATAALSPRPEISLTSNGIGLDRRAAALRDAGLDRINVSLDTLRPEVFRKLTHRDRLPDVLSGLAAAASAGLTPVKINAVLMRDLNDDEAPDLLRYCVERGYELRLIEQMPLDAQHGWKRTEMVTAAEIFQSLSASFELSEDTERTRGAAPAETFHVNGGPARVGVIASVTRPFCGACDRVRLTADGQIRNCLFARSESDLRALLRSDASDADIAGRWRAAVASKLPGHGINDPTFLQPDRPMSAIGG